jgi:hypothetical protein
MITNSLPNVKVTKITVEDQDKSTKIEINPPHPPDKSFKLTDDSDTGYESMLDLCLASLTGTLRLDLGFDGTISESNSIDQIVIHP